MSLFDTILVQPIFNVLVFIYSIIPGHDFGVALILFTILVRLALWPLIKKQLHQTKIIRRIQPELKKIRTQTKGNKQLAAQLTMELYREKGINPFGSIGVLLLQLPIFIALYAVVRIITESRGDIPRYTYSFLEQIPFVKELVANPNSFSEMLFGVVNLTRHAVGPAGLYWPLFLLAILAAGLQFIQSKQLLPKVDQSRKLRDILKEQASGKQVDQSEMSALMTSRMIYLFPALTFFVSIYLSGALVLYLAMTSLVAVIQQTIVLRKDADELEQVSSKTSQKVKQVKEAEVVSEPRPAKKKRRKK